MCGRFTLISPAEAIEAELGLAASSADLAPRYNIAPGQSVVVVRNTDPRRLDRARWGLVPWWAKDPKIGYRMINARVESLPEKPAFRSALRDRRCLVPCDGFYEWKGERSPKVPYYIRLKSGRPFAFAGLWEDWRSEKGDQLRSCTIVTVPARGAVEEIHDRMPLILSVDGRAAWLATAPTADDLIGFSNAAPVHDLEVYEVSTMVNRPENDDPRCIEPA